MTDKKTHYEFLDLPSNATTQEIRQRCLELRISISNSLDPTRRVDQLHALLNAEKTLMDPTLRAKYDHELIHGSEPAEESPKPSGPPLLDLWTRLKLAVKSNW